MNVRKIPVIVIRYMLIYAFMLVTIKSSGQTKHPGLKELFSRYERAKADTEKVRLLLQIDSIYLYKRADTDQVLDSALLMAQQAAGLSMKLNFEKGYQDATFLAANTLTEMNKVRATLPVINSAKPVLQVRMLIMLGEHFVFKPGQLRQNLDSAYPFIIRALKISDSMRSYYWKCQSVCILGKYHFASGNLVKGKDCFMQMIETAQRSGNKKEEAVWWAELGRYIPHTDSTYNHAIRIFAQALSLYTQTGNIIGQEDMLESMANLHLLHNELSAAETEINKALKLRQSIDRLRLYDDYSALSHIHSLKGNYNISLYYALAAVKNLDSLEEDTYMGGVIYSQLADAYKAAGETDKSMQWYKLALDRLVFYKNEYMFTICGQIVHALLDRGSPVEALAFLQSFIRKNGPPRLVDKQIVAAAMGDCYNALGRYDMAETNYQRMMVLDAQVQAHLNKETQGDRGNKITGAEAYYTAGRFYVERRQYKLARTYLKQILAFERFKPSLQRLRDIHGLLFKIDSAEGSYLSAIQHLTVQKQLNDSIFNERKSRQIEELQIQYETVKNDKDLQVLRTREQLQNKELQKTTEARNFTYILLLILAVLLSVVYSRYMLKQKSNRQLQAKQEEINQKNIFLEHLLKDKDGLIVEKDLLLEEKQWLLKEVHHRVKNNLQIVMSLLNTQSRYLDNKAAVDAISNSRHRMQAMSLIHQELYHTQNAALVNMKTYIGELVDYLTNNFVTDKQLHYDLQVTAVELDIVQAIPLGLILNEIITNAIKYAFIQKENGVILIAMQKLGDNSILLEVQDNGKGFDEGFHVNTSNSMGLRLIRGLVKQIEGELVIKSGEGVSIQIKFQD